MATKNSRKFGGLGVVLYGALALGTAWLSGCELDGGGGGGGGTVTLANGYVFVRDDDLYVADQADYTTVGQLTTDGSNKQPSLSANLQRAVYVHAPVGGTPSIRAVATNGSGTPQTLYSAASGERNFRTPVFSPDGTKIVFAYDDAGGISHLGSIDASGASTGLTDIIGGTRNYASPSFYSDGTHVLAMTGTGSAYTALEKVDITNGSVVVIASSLGGTADQIAGRVVLSPDENNAVFDARVLGSGTGISRIYLKDLTAATTDAVALSDHPGDQSALDVLPAWVSSSRIAFSSNSGGLDNVYEISTTGTAGPGSLVLPSARDPWYGP